MGYVVPRRSSGHSRPRVDLAVPPVDVLVSATVLMLLVLLFTSFS